MQCRAVVARFFVTGVRGGGGHYRECRRQEPCGAVWGYPPQENCQIWRLRNAIFSTFHGICLRKIDLEYENGKQLQVKSSQVTIIKITKSTENNSIDRLLMCPAQQVQGAAAPLPPH